MIALAFEKNAQLQEILFHTDTFDSFLLAEAFMVTDYSITLENNSESENVPYGRIRTLLSDIQKDNTSPDAEAMSKCRLTLRAPLSYQKSLTENPAFSGDPEIIKGLILTFRIENGKTTALTGISYQSFTLDKSIERLWDQAILKSFDRMNISYEIL